MAGFGAWLLTVGLCSLASPAVAQWGPGSEDSPEYPDDLEPGAPIPITRPKDVRIPPNIIEFEYSRVIKGESSSCNLPCTATGTLPLSYSWLKDGKRIEFSNNQQYKLQNGNLILTNIGRSHQGYYQCLASNQYGVAVSPMVEMAFAYIGSYTPAEKMIRQIHVTEGEPLRFSCVPLDGNPKPLSYTWYEVKAIDQAVGESKIQTGQRVTQDPQGNLYFAHVTRDDMRFKPDGSHWIYKCNVKEVYTDQTPGGSYTNLTVKEVQGSPPSAKPAIKYWSVGTRVKPQESEQIVALLGEDLDIVCIFSGNPTPSNSDLDKEGGAFPHDRYVASQYKDKMTITKVQASDAGVYVCRGHNSAGKDERRFTIIVKAKPIFESDNFLSNTNATEGDTVALDCRTQAEPAAKIDWFQDGQPLDASSMPDRMEVKDGRLYVKDVCKKCASGPRPSDLMVFQCNASNQYGHAFANGYLNVLLRSKMVKSPPSNVFISSSNGTTQPNITLECAGETDDSTPLLYTWWFNDRKVSDLSKKVYTVLYNKGLVININAIPDEERESYAGSYFCEVSNGYSTAPRAESVVQIEPRNDRQTGAGLSYTLMIIIICLCIILFLFIIILCCCMYYYRNRGDEYDVDKVERWRGNDPEKELAENGYQEFVRTMDTGTLKGSRAGLGSRASLASKRTLDDDEEGLLGDGYFGQGTFNEDGSFIGQYNTASRSKNM